MAQQILKDIAVEEAQGAANLRERSAPAKRVVRKNLNATLRALHKRVGIFAFLFMGWLGLSGIMLNESADWGFDAVRVASPSVMWFYGLDKTLPTRGFVDNQDWLASTTEKTVVNGYATQEPIPSPLGMLSIQEGGRSTVYVATKEKLLALDGEANLVEEIPDYMLPVPGIVALGKLHQEGQDLIALRGENTYVSRDAFSWRQIDSNAAIQWSSMESLSPGMIEQTDDFASPTVSLEQLLIDLHSGRLFGEVGPWVINTVGFAALWLSVTGIWLTYRTGKRKVR